MLRADQVISSICSEYLARMTVVWRGRERELLIECVRSLDEAAFARTLAPNREQLLREDGARQLMLLGAASAMRPLVEALRGDPGGVPWGPTSAPFSSLADQHLINCGQLAVVHRTATLERYGLAKATFKSDNHLVLEAASDDDEVGEVNRSFWLSGLIQRQFAEVQARMAEFESQVAARISRYTDTHEGWCIQYDAEEDVLAYYRDLATIDCAGTAEADALPGNVLLGGRPFSEWNEASITAYGVLLHHIACATRLRATAPHLELRNLLTIFARKDDLAAVWRERGESDAGAAGVISGLSFDADVASYCERHHEIPLPYYIDFGEHFVLLPVFGGLLNAVAGLSWHLRQAYRQDWDRAVNAREQTFRDDLRALFPPPRYIVPNRSIRLRRADGTDLTDVDAVVLDRERRRLALIQLKWPEIYGRSLAERDSRRINLLKANEWVQRVSGWVAGRSSSEISLELRLGDAGPEGPVLLVLARHTARFVGEFQPDPRAHWLSWPELVHRCHVSSAKDVLGSLAKRKQPKPRRRPKRSTSSVYQLPGLRVEIHAS